MMRPYNVDPFVIDRAKRIDVLVNNAGVANFTHDQR